MSTIDDVDIGIIEVRIPYSFTLVDNISEEVDKAIKDSLRLLMKDEILDVLNMACRELGISTKKEE